MEKIVDLHIMQIGLFQRDLYQDDIHVLRQVPKDYVLIMKKVKKIRKYHENGYQDICLFASMILTYLNMRSH